MKNSIKPIILLEGKYSTHDLEKLKKENPIWNIVDLYQDQLKELFEIKNPHLKTIANFAEKMQKYLQDKKGNTLGNWIYFPWNGYLIHTVGKRDYFLLRTNRNKNLINESEQKILYESCIGVIGLSVGGGITLSLVYHGIGKNLKLAEKDKLETTNLNRLRSGLHYIGKDKISIISEQIYEVDPYASLKLFPEGLNNQNLDGFFSGEPKPKIVFDEIDDFEMKVKLRLKAKENGVAIIMLTNLGDNILVDIERYDLDKNISFFNGLLGKTPEEILTSKITEKEKIKYAIEIVGIDHIPTIALQCLLSINKTLIGRPQLSSSVFTSSGLAAYLVRQILLRKNLKSGRYFITLDKLFDIETQDQGRVEILEQIKKILGDNE